MGRAFNSFINIDLPNGQAGLKIDADGVGLQPIRRHYERRAWEEQERAAGRITD